MMARGARLMGLQRGTAAQHRLCGAGARPPDPAADGSLGCAPEAVRTPRPRPAAPPSGLF